MYCSAAFLLAAVSIAIVNAQSCFPYGGATLPKDGSAPNMSVEDWWCPQSMAYGFQGFSYPMEDGNCNDVANSYDQINADFAQMKRDFDVSVVRLYYVVCTESIVLQNVLRAAVENNLAVIFQVWTNFGDGVRIS